MNLGAGETGSLYVGCTPNSGEEGILVVELADADGVEAVSFRV